MIGKILGNRYEILEKLGGGGMALVYKAKCTLLNRTVTVKILRPEFTNDEDFVERFRREAQSVAKLSHPNIVSVYDVGEEDGIYYIIMEYIDGQTLKEVIKEKGKLPVNEAVDITQQICKGIGHAHENGIVHRDIKPHNILITRSGLVKVTDFGIARAVTAATVTHSGTILGSVHYASPEQAKGEDTGTGSDIYSVGVVLYELLTGKVPFDGETPIAVAIKHIQEIPLPPTRIEPSIPPELEKVVMRAMEKEVKLRYSSAYDMANDLSTVLDGKLNDRTRVIPVDDYATKVLPAEALAKELGKTVNEQPQNTKKKKLKPVYVVGIAVAVILLLVLGVFGIQSYMVVPDVNVPDVTKMTFVDAKRTLEDRGLKAVITDKQYSIDIPNNRVITTNPKPGLKAKKGRVINLTMSLGIQTAKVPDVRKKTFIDASYELDRAGFKIDRKDEYDSTLPKDTVIDQEPGKDSDLALGSVVTLTVSKGPELALIQVPDITNKTMDQARDLLKQFLLTLDENVTKQSNKDYLPGRVINQDPQPGSPLQQGSSVKLTISDGPGPDFSENKNNIVLTPQDSNPQEYVIKIIDAEGTKEIFKATLVKGQDQKIPVSYYTSSKFPPKYQIWMSGKMTDEQNLPY